MRPNYFDFDRYRSRGPYARHDECSPCRAIADLAWAGLALASTWAKRARARRELARFDRRMLRDIAVTPSEAVQEYDKPFWRA
jgi:uncharacterized protein YjiS (DUF1127 family)